MTGPKTMKIHILHCGYIRVSKTVPFGNSIDLKNTGKLRKYIPEEKVFVSESGIMTDEDIKYLKELKVDAFLIGRAFMESQNPKELATRWKSL